jgi:hypothetical protein
MKTRSRKYLIWLAAFSLIMACVPSVGTPAVPTLDPNAINLFIQQTVEAAASQTAAAMPTSTATQTATPTPLDTNTPEPTATNTVIFILSTPTPPVIPTFTGLSSGGTSSANFACQVIRVNPANGTRLSPRTDFDAVWTVRNIGRRDWDRNSVDYYYLSGDRFHKVSGYDMRRDVKVGETVEIGVDMEAPATNGTYTTNWTMQVGSEQFCTMTLTIVVR